MLQFILKAMFVRTVLMPLFEWQQRYRVYTLMSYGGFQRLKSNIPKFADDTYILKGLLLTAVTDSKL